MDQASRNVSEKFPVRTLLIDTTHPWTIDVSENVSKALSHFFALVTNATGSNKIPSLNIFLLGKEIECVYPLQAVKSNVAKLIRVIHEMKNQPGIESIQSCYQDKLSVAVEQAFSQFRRSFVANRQPTGALVTQVEICIVTCQKRKIIEKCFEKILENMGITVLKKIQIIHIKPDFELNSPIDKTEDNGSQDCDVTLSEESIHEYFEVILVSNDCIEIEYTFKSWLVDNGADDVQLVIDINHTSTNGITLKCDVNERLLNLSMVPYSQLKLFQSGAQRNNCMHCSTSVKNVHSSLKAFHFKVIKLISNNGICESVPLILRPTSCWKLDWEKLDLNQQNFQAVRTFLLQQEMCMLLESQETTATCPRTFCILFPSGECGMLLKCISSRDVLLPLSSSLCIQKQSDFVQQQIDSLLMEIPKVSSLNPLHLKAGIAEKLLLTFNTNDTRRHIKGVKRQINDKSRNCSKQISNEVGSTNHFNSSSVSHGQKRTRFPCKPIANKGSIFTRDLPDFPDEF